MLFERARDASDLGREPEDAGRGGGADERGDSTRDPLTLRGQALRRQRGVSIASGHTLHVAEQSHELVSTALAGLAPGQMLGGIG